ncbi:MAG: sigma-70 family RNA polymerase sigma factor [Candidatus Krumholzibacteriia bacterium]
MTGDPRTLDDRELVDRCRATGCEDASGELFRRHRQRVYLWCYRMTHDHDEAIDLTQEVFIRVFRSLDGFDGRASFTTWVYTIARNTCLNQLTSRRAQWRRRLAEVDQLEVADEAAVERLRQAELAGELDALLVRAGRVTEPDELDAFVLHYRDGLTVNEITRLLGCTNTTGARTLIQNARRKLRRLVKREDGSA